MTVPEVRPCWSTCWRCAWDVAEILRWSAWRQERNRRAAARSHRKRHSPSEGDASEVEPGNLHVMLVVVRKQEPAVRAWGHDGWVAAVVQPCFRTNLAWGVMGRGFARVLAGTW